MTMMPLRKLKDDLKRSRTFVNPLFGGVSALDGIAITIKKPDVNQKPKHYRRRNGPFAFLFGYGEIELEILVCE